MRAPVILLVFATGCAEAPRTDPWSLVARIGDDDEAERLLIEAGPEADKALSDALARGEAEVRVRLRRILRERENRRIGPVEFLANGKPTACDADGGNRRTITAYAPPEQARGLEVVDGNIVADGRRLTNERADREPARAPDGRHVAIVTERDGDAEIYTVNVETLWVRRLTYSPGPDRSPRWSRDGSAIFFVSERDGRPQIYRVGRDGTDLRRISDGMADDRF